MNAPANAVQAFVKASRPTFSSSHDKVAFACHAVAAVNGLRLVAVGQKADGAEPPSSQAPEVPVDGWNDAQGEYAFRYIPEPSSSAGSAPASTSACASLLLKCLPVDGGMFVTLASSRADGSQPPPETLELDVQRYAVPEGSDPDTGTSPYQYGHLSELVGKVQQALEAQISSPAATSTSAAAKNASSTSAAKSSDRQPTAANPVGAGDRAGTPGRSPLLADDFYDRMPGGFDPMHLGGGAHPGIMPFGPGGGPMSGGGMHVGPSHPMFAGRMRHPPPGGLGGMGGGPGMPGLPAGARWDPIAPEGLPGFHPEDFQRGQPGPGRGGPPVHPDMMQPGAGRGTDWDSMFS